MLSQAQCEPFWRDGELVVEDAVEADQLVRGEASGRVRCSSYEMQLPEVPKDTSFFAQQAAAEEA